MNEQTRVVADSIAVIYHHWQDTRMEFARLIEIVGNEPAFETGLLLAGDVDPDLTGPWGESIDSHLVFALRGQHRSDEAIEIYRRIMRHDPDDSSSYSNLAQLLMQLQRVDEAEELYRQEISRFHGDHWGHYCLGVLLQKRGQADQAREQYVLALQKAYWQLQQWPGCIDDEIVEEMEGALRDVGGDPASVSPYKPGLWNRLRRREDK